MSNILITICARGGSKGIPNKNIKLMNGKPLIAYTIDVAKAFSKKFNADIALSTDSEKIKTIATEFGLLTNYNRPETLASDTSGKIDAILDVLLFEERKRSKSYDFIIDLDVTSPLRNLQDITEAFELIKNNKEAYNIFSVNPAARNPYFNMVEEGKDGFVHLVKAAEKIKSRQEAPPVYDMNASFYIYSKSFFTFGCKVSTTDRSLAYVVRHMCFDLDHPFDFIIMELMLEKGLLDFDLRDFEK